MNLIFTRTIVFYLICFCVMWRLLDYNKLISNAIPQTLNQLTPSIDYFSEFVDKTDHYDRSKLMDSIIYHKAVANFFTFQKAEADAMLGFCYARLNRPQEAIAYYQQAIKLSPENFWPYYDLGVIYYTQAQYAQAVNYFDQALGQDPVKTIVLLYHSKVYNDVKLSGRDGSYDFPQGLKEGRKEAYVLMMDSLYKTGAYEQLLGIAVNGIKEGLNDDGIFYKFIKAVQLHQQGVEVNVPHLNPKVRFF